MRRSAICFDKFNEAYDAALLPDNPDKFNLIAAKTRFNIYNSPIWSGTGRLFALALIEECCQQVRTVEAEAIRKHFGIDS